MGVIDIVVCRMATKLPFKWKYLTKRARLKARYKYVERVRRYGDDFFDTYEEYRQDWVNQFTGRKR